MPVVDVAMSPAGDRYGLGYGDSDTGSTSPAQRCNKLSEWAEQSEWGGGRLCVGDAELHELVGGMCA